MNGGSGIWSAAGDVISALLGAAALVGAGLVAARATTTAARSSAQAQDSLQEAKTLQGIELEGLVRALARAYDEMRVWARHPVGDPPEPNDRVKEFYRTGR